MTGAFRTVFGWLVVVAVSGVAAPAVARDPIETWLEAAARAEPVDDLRVSLGVGVRWDDRFGEVERVLPELSAVYSVFRWLRVGGGYRFTADRRGEGDFRYLHRFSADARLSREIGERLEVQWRTRLQEELSSDPDGNRQREAAWRNRVGFEVEAADSITPFASWELFSPFAARGGVRPDAPKWRATAGVSFDLGRHRLEPFYHLEQTVGRSTTERSHVLGLGYRFDI